MRPLPPLILLILYLGMNGLGAAETEKVPAQDALVNVQEEVPDVMVDIRYATEDNFLKRQVYPSSRCYLRYAVARRLARAQDLLKKKGLGLKIWDGYRPLSVQKQMWDILPDPDYVADPKHGSRHNRGAAVDVTLVDASGRELIMPTEFDDFTPAAHVDAPCKNAQAAANRKILQDTMKMAGFESMPTEWWHFDAPEWRGYEVLDISFEEIEAGNIASQERPETGKNIPVKPKTKR